MNRQTQRVMDMAIRLWSRTRLDWNYPLRKMGAALRADKGLSGGERRDPSIAVAVRMGVVIGRVCAPRPFGWRRRAATGVTSRLRAR